MHKEFLTGSAKSIWCTFVTMATVGYGDVSPVTFLGRVIMTFWIVMSLFVVGIMTSMISDTVMGDSVFDVANERVAVVRESIAERVVKNNNARVVICKTYEEVGWLLGQGGEWSMMSRSSFSKREIFGSR